MSTSSPTRYITSFGIPGWPGVVDQVATIPFAEGADGKLFGRLSATEN